MLCALLLPLLASCCAQHDSPRLDAEPAPHRIAVLGSSVAAGWVTSRETKHDLQNGWVARLGRLLEPRGFAVESFAQPGLNTGNVLELMDHVLVDPFPDMAIVGLSLPNEGIAEDRDAAVESFLDGMRSIVSKLEERGIQPVLGLCYANDGFSELDARAVREVNLELQGWGYPCIDLLGALDDGECHFPEGFTYDDDHPDEGGHEELFLSVVPSLFEALTAGVPAPTRPVESAPTRVEPGIGPVTLSWIPQEPVHSFSSTFSVQITHPGALAAIRSAQGWVSLEVDAEGKLAFLGPGNRSRFFLDVQLLDGRWHHISIVHRHLQGGTVISVDGGARMLVRERFEPRQLVLGGGGSARSAAPAAAEYRDWWVHRAALTPEGLRALAEGAVLPASLEVYAPLDGLALESDERVENRARSTARVFAHPSDPVPALEALEARIQAARAEREAQRIFADPEVVELEPALVAEYAGRYELAPGDGFDLRAEGARLFLIDRGQEVEVFALARDRFFIRTVGEPTLTFRRDAGGRVTAMVLAVGEMELPPAERVD